MAQKPDKVIVSNHVALVKKYGAGGAGTIGQALTRMIQSDLARGLSTLVVEIDDTAQMQAFGGSPVINASDQQGAKKAVDAICAKVAPDYLMLLDGPDIVPHIVLSRIPGIVDADQTVDSDLPYASASPFGRQASSFLTLTRVVGRLPNAPGASSSADLVGLIDRCADHLPKAASAYQPYFSISAAPWQQSTQLSLSAIFGSHAGLQLCPLAGHTAIDASLGSLAHFINCHGGTADPQFYGQQDLTYPVAMESSQVAPHVLPGTVAAAECCYGAQLYDPALVGVASPICMSYLRGGAIGFMGSTTISYGPASTNGQADLLAQDFLHLVLNGASLGRAMLQARQRFVASQSMSSPTNLKTLAQFLLLGDPSLLAVTPPQTVTPDEADGAKSVTAAAEDAKDAKSARKARRLHLLSEGLAVASASTFPGRRVKGSAALVDRVRSLFKSRGFDVDPTILSVSGGAQYLDAAKSLDAKRLVAVVTEKLPDHHVEETGARHPRYRVLTAHILGDGITAVDECESR